MRRRAALRIACAAILVAVLLASLAWWQPDFPLVAALELLHPDVLWRVRLPSGDLSVALSLDDGPSDLTPRILELLEEHDAHATFFVLGSHILESRTAISAPDPLCPNASHPASLYAAHLRSLGHETGHHTWLDRRTLSLPLKDLEPEFDRLDALLFPCGPGNATRWFRPGHGVFDSKLVAWVHRKGYRTVLGNVHPFDPQIRNAKLNAWHVVNRARPGAIIILHDGRTWTLETLRIALPELRRRGFRILTISELVKRAER
ncbi:hypothetical protein DFJ74DRAFT_135577 [Hyaloraphidium curvatum]|nr:hypothetical protein DFJ74DRAFT_135577 [Hyaloraphidium curvatum]